MPLLLWVALFFAPLPAAAGDPLPAGSWVSAPSRHALTPLQIAAWGPRASAVRTGELTIEPSGQGVLRLATRIIADGGRVISQATTIEEFRFVLEQPGAAAAGNGDGRDGALDERDEIVVVVREAARWYPSSPQARWTIDGARLRITRVGSGFDVLEVLLERPGDGGKVRATFTRARTSPKGA